MKKITKILAVILSVIVCLSAFSIMPFAAAKRPNAKSSEKELLAYHEERVNELINNGDFKAENDWSLNLEVDTKKLPAGVDAKKVQKEYNYSEGDKSTVYFNDKDVVRGTFSIADDKETFGLKYKSMKVSQSGEDTTVVLVYTETWGTTGKTTDTYTIVYDAVGNIVSYNLNQKSTYTDTYEGKTITLNEEVNDSYTFTYELTFFDKIILFFRKLFFWLY